MQPKPTLILENNIVGTNLSTPLYINYAWRNIYHENGCKQVILQLSFLNHKRKGIKVDTKLLLEQFSILKVSKVIRNHIGFAVPHYAIGPENLHHFHNQSNAKLKPNTNWLHASSCT